MKVWAPWMAVLLVVVAALFVGTVGQQEPTPTERAQSVASTIRCPTCDSQAVSSSDTPSAQAVRSLITDRIEAGDSDEAIRDYVDSRYPGQNLLLDPAGSGFGGLVWALPVIMVVVAVAGLVVRFGSYGGVSRTASAADRDLVAAAQQASEDDA